ncbi:MAG: HNH endonuclease, partial [Acidimicrobiia bacterium]
AHLSTAVAQLVVDAVMDDAPALTTGQLAARLRRLCIEVDPDDAADRYERAVEDRRVVCEPTTGGTAHLMALDVPPHRAAAVTHRINQIATSLRGDIETRTLDQIRADVMLDLLDGTADASRPSSGRGVVDIRIDLATLTGLEDSAGDLAGYGPVVADIARAVAEEQRESEWRYAVTDPGTGGVVANGVSRRRPTASQRRHVETRDTTCVFPGCRMPATGCDLDHQTPWAQSGETTVDNLAPLCRHDHRIRHQANWTHTRLANGTHQWTTTLGHTYTTSGTPP